MPTSIHITCDPRRPPLTRVLLNGQEVYVSHWSVDQSMSDVTRVTLEFLPDEFVVVPPDVRPSAPVGKVDA